jgi:hypothetical protein
MDYSTDSVTRYIKHEEKSLDKTKKNWFQFIKDHGYFLVWFIILFLLSYFLSFLSPAPEQTHFIDLATSFLKGHLYVVNPSRLFDDIAIYNNHTYVFYNPLPAILLLPFVFIFGATVHQALLTPVLTIINFFLIYRIARKVGVESSASLWLALSSIFGSIYLLLSIATISAYLVQVVGFTCLLLAIHEYFYKRWLLVGLFVGLAAATRVTLILGSIFFLIEIFRSHETIKHRVKSLTLFLIPLFCVCVALGWYNFARFGTMAETGYTYQTSTNPIYNVSRIPGVFSPVHIPGNLYFLLFKGPDVVKSNEYSYILTPPYFRVSEWGMGMFFTSPIFLYLLLVRKRDPYVLSAGVTILVMLAPILTYFVSGIWQYGYRYGLDFYPFLFLLLFPVFKQGLPLIGKLLIMYSIIFTFFFMYSIWNIYPFLSILHSTPH